jgi:SanA protein
MAADPARDEKGGWFRRARRLLSLASLLAGAVTLASNLYLLRATKASIVDGVGAAPKRAFAILLGTSVFPDGRLAGGLAARTQVALDLYRAGKVRKLFVSGAYRPAQSYDEPGAMAAWLERRGVPHDAIILDRLGRRTAATMANAAAQGVRDALVCTQAYHQPRALYLASQAGIDAVGVAADNRGGDRVDRLRARVREILARTETLLEVWTRGVSAR